MFDFLPTRSWDQTIGGVYFAMRLIKHRTELGESKNGARFEWLLADSDPDERKLALKIIDEIERSAKSSFVSLSQAAADKYVRRLGGIVEKQIRKELTHEDMKQGEKLLQEMRQSGVSNSWHLLNSSAQRSQRRTNSKLRSPSPKKSKSIQAAVERA